DVEPRHVAGNRTVPDRPMAADVAGREGGNGLKADAGSLRTGVVGSATALSRRVAARTVPPAGDPAAGSGSRPQGLPPKRRPRSPLTGPIDPRHHSSPGAPPGREYARTNAGILGVAEVLARALNEASSRS